MEQEQLEMKIDDTSDFLSSNGYGKIMCGHMSPKLEARFGRLVLDKAVEEGRLPAIASAAGKPIPPTCLPKPTPQAETVTGNQFLVLTSLQSKAKKRADIAEELGAPKNSVSATLQTLKRRQVPIHHAVHSECFFRSGSRPGTEASLLV